MSVSDQVQPSIEGRPIPGLPIGIQQWTACATATGNTSGGVNDVSVDFNPSLGRTFQPYVAIENVFVRGVGGDPGDASLFQPSTSWERLINNPAPQNGHINRFEMGLVDTNDYVGTMNQWIHLGRSAQGSSGRITVRFPNVNSVVIQVVFNGLLSDRPFMLDSRWVV